MKNLTIIVGKFDEIYLKVPQEILIITMQQHQKYFSFDNNDKLTNIFLFVSNLPDKKGFIKLETKELLKQGFQMLKFFWEKNKNHRI